VNKVSKMYNYRNPVDWALFYPKVWLMNNKLKPDVVYDDQGIETLARWGSDRTNSCFYWTPDGSQHDVLSLQNDRYEIFSFCAQSRSLALGGSTTRAMPPIIDYDL
jgi:hypothetical protein